MQQQENKPRSLYEAFDLYAIFLRASESEKRANATIAQLQTMLLRYLLPGWGFPKLKGSKITDFEKQVGLDNLKSIELKRLQEAPEILQQQLKQSNVSGGSERTQRYILNRFLAWCESQEWLTWISSEQAEVKPAKLSGSDKSIRTTNRKALTKYSLRATQKSQIPSHLQQELDEFYQFRISPATGLGDLPVKPITAKNDLTNIQLILGWLHHYKAVPLEDLSLQQLVPFVPLRSQADKKGREQIQATVEYTIQLVRAYIEWLQASSSSGGRESQSSRTAINIVQTWIAVAKFVYRFEMGNLQGSSFSDIPVVKALRHVRRTQRLIEEKPTVTTNEELSWVEFLQMVEVLRAECEVSQPSRTLTAIAQSYQRFLIFAFLAYLPPQQQIVYRELQFIPFHENQDNFQRKQQENSCLYQENETWWISLAVNKHKSKRFGGSITLKVPNLTYPGDRTFYEYLEAWLIGNIAKESLKSIPGGLRSSFHPSHSCVFTKHNGQPYQNSTEFRNIIKNASLRITGKVLTPHTVRRMFVSYVLQQGYSEPLIESLAELMGYSSESLRRIYACPRFDKTIKNEVSSLIEDWVQASLKPTNKE
ncbi:site-specific integrase [Oscillatoria sp. FACHB-1407]|uniref:site-specific integrase n=1 Tax=Oscillatoria sp. FACHB-1407 TaxID=2692847 RepID=UPI001682468F|nr:site-specific integrase [Oscillatoria sp. FACHB-1407]MBD2463382.1 site-specific integrase [Oscillatoria sp. FACHB-1407]